MVFGRDGKYAIDERATMHDGGPSVLQSGTKMVLVRLAWAGAVLLSLVGVVTLDFLRHGGNSGSRETGRSDIRMITSSSHVCGSMPFI